MQDTRWGWVSYPSAEKHSVYSTAPADWAKSEKEKKLYLSFASYRRWFEELVFNAVADVTE